MTDTRTLEPTTKPRLVVSSNPNQFRRDRWMLRARQLLSPFWIGTPLRTNYLRAEYTNHVVNAFKKIVSTPQRRRQLRPSLRIARALL